MKKKNVFLLLIIMFFLILGLFVYRMCDSKYSFELEYYYDKLEYLEEHPEFGAEIERLEKPSKPSATELYGMVLDNNIVFLSQWIMPLVIIILSTYQFYKILHSGFIKNISSRKIYSKYIKSSVFKMWLKSIIVFVIPHLFIFIICLFYSEFKLFDNNSIYVSKIFNDNIYLFFSLFLYYIFYAIFCCNLGLIFIKKQRKYIIDLILAGIVYILLAVFLELGIATIIDNLALQYNNLSIYSTSFTFLSVFTIFPYYYINIHNTLWVTMLIIIILVIFTTCLVYLIYSNKESVMIESEN